MSQPCSCLRFSDALLLGRKGVLTKTDFPDDLDTTSLGLTIMGASEDVKHSILDQMLQYRNPDGIVQVSTSQRPHGILKGA